MRNRNQGMVLLIGTGLLMLALAYIVPKVMGAMASVRTIPQHTTDTGE